MSLKSSFLSAAALSLVLASCGDDPELVRKREEQRAELRKLRSELDVLDERLKNAPKDRSADLAKLEEETAAREEKISALETEVAALEAKKKELEAEFEDYRRKYPIR
ncbi:MAG: hypothetical protein MUF31_13485 [Akkermansiaceae bacterium]|jgi:septal ring factor EnvC (AmiA/AmiB activator)|nr:hypothetical protein [Akkermansiaceae bacterium]